MPNSQLSDIPIYSMANSTRELTTIMRSKTKGRWKSRKVIRSLSALIKWGLSRFGIPFLMRYWRMRDQGHKCLLRAIWRATKTINLYTNSWWKSLLPARSSPCRNWKPFWWENISISCRLNVSAKRPFNKNKDRNPIKWKIRQDSNSGFQIQIISPRIS